MHKILLNLILINYFEFKSVEKKKVENFSEKNVVALCVAMHLPPWLSFALIL